MCGVVSALKPNTLSKALKGQNAVYVVYIAEKKAPQGAYSKAQVARTFS